MTDPLPWAELRMTYLTNIGPGCDNAFQAVNNPWLKICISFKAGSHIPQY